MRASLSTEETRTIAALTVGALGLAALVALTAGEPADGARLAGATVALSRRAEVTNADVEILHLPDPVTAARDRLGTDADALIAEGEALSVEEAVDLASRA